MRTSVYTILLTLPTPIARNIKNLRALFFNHLQVFNPESPNPPFYRQSRTGRATLWVRLSIRPQEPPCLPFVK
jgi:hypothetical protein